MYFPGCLRRMGTAAVYRFLPDSLRDCVLRLHYHRLLHSFEMDREPSLKIVKELVAEGDIVVDVGANIGVYTKFLSSFVGSGGVVVSIEPVPSTYDILANNIRALGLKNVRSLCGAISDEIGSATVEIPANRYGGYNHYLAHVVDIDDVSENLRVIVPKTTIDAVLADHSGKVSLIKIDTEGHELSCILGAKQTLTRSKPALLIEVTGDMDSTDTDAAELVRFLEGFGYSAYVQDGDSIRPCRIGDKAVNYFFLVSAPCKEGGSARVE